MTALSILAAAAQEPARAALITRSESWTFAEAARAVRARLQTWPAGPTGYAEPLSASRTLDAVVALWAALEARRPVGLLHPQQPAPQRELARRALAEHRLPDDAALVLFTSGTTGAPRGVLHRRAALEAAAAMHATRLPWQEDDRTLLALPLAAAGGLMVLVRSLAARRPIVLLEEAADWPLAQALAESRATLASLVPAQLAAVLDDPRWRPPPSLRAVLVGGAACPPSLQQRARARGLPLLVTYGMTETLGQVATALPPDFAPNSASASASASAPISVSAPDSDSVSASASASDSASDSVSASDSASTSVSASVPASASASASALPLPSTQIGPPMPGVLLWAGTAAAPSRIIVAGPTCMIGYLGEPAARDGRVHTADLGWLDERGLLHVLGRADDLITTGGHKVAPSLIEEAARGLAGVRDAYAFGLADDRWGQVIALALAVAPPFELEAAATHWRASLPAHLRPRRVALLATLPRNPNGKVDGAAVRALALVDVPYATSSRS